MIAQISSTLTTHTVPVDWSAITPESVEPSIKQIIETTQTALNTIAALPTEQLNFDNTFRAFDDSLEALATAWGKVSHLSNVNDSEQLRQAYNTTQPVVIEFLTQVYFDTSLYNTLHTFAQSSLVKSLSSTEQRFISETILDFQQHGAELSPENKATLTQTETKLAEIAQKFSENVLDATNAWEKTITDPSELDGIPEVPLNTLRQNALAKNLGTPDNPQYRITLQHPSSYPVLKYANSESLRKEVYLASNALCSGGDFDNTSILREILKLRSTKAQLLGFNSFPDWVLARRMKNSGQNAINFIQSLHQQIAPKFQAQIQELKDFKATQSSDTSFNPWELAFLLEKHRKTHLDFDEESLRPYFEVNSAINGLFDISEQLFGIAIEELDTSHISTWDPEVRYYSISDEDHILGYFYTDWFPRENKRGGAWMVPISPRFDDLPAVGAIHGNFTPPASDQPALITHNEAATLFHEFGHLLHHLLSEVPIKSMNGLNVPWDFVELPSQLLENWCWERESLDLFAQHYQTGDTIPEDLFQKLLQTRTHFCALHKMRQAGFSLLDLELHLNPTQYTEGDLDTTIHQFLKDYTIPYTHTPLSITRQFSHLFGDSTGYASGYYSYLWSEVLEADAFGRFLEEGILNPQTGHDFRQQILTPGNSLPAEELFRNFRGRDPELTPFLQREALI